MKLQVIQSIKQGLEIIIKNPVILAPIVINAVLNCIFIYFFVYTPKLAYFSKVAPVLPEHFALYAYAILSLLISSFLLSMVCKMVYDAVKGNVSISEAVSLSLRKLVFIFIATILYSLIVTIGLIALIVPGIFLLNKFAFYNYAILLDNTKIIDSFEKSWRIVTGNWWGVFGIHLIFLILIMILSTIASIIAPVSVQVAIILDFISILLLGWLMSVFTIAYIQLTKQETTETQ